MNFVEAFAEEPSGSAEPQFGGGVGSARQLLVSGFFSELQQVLQLQSPGQHAQNQQAGPDPQHAPGSGTHGSDLMGPQTRSSPAVFPRKEAEQEARAAGRRSASSRHGGVRGGG